MKSHATPPVFVGRQEQLASLQEALAAVPAVVVVEGEPGIGKTTLVDRFVEPLAHMRVVRASGVESERDLSFGVADQILRRCAADPVVGVTADPVIVGARLLDALADAAPVVLVVDDAQWADAASLRALLFAWRRLVADRVLVVLATRDGCLPEGLVKAVDRRLRLPPLGAVELARLAAGLGVELPVPDAERLHAHTGGVPLHARAVLEELPAGRRALPEGELPAPRTFALVVARRLQACSEPARALAEAVAVLGPCSLAQAAELATATAEDGAPVAAFEALDEASAAGLLTPGTGRDVGPAHPLVGAAVLGAMPMARRARM